MRGESRKRTFVVAGLLLAAGLWVAARSAAARTNDPSAAVVKLYVTAVARDLTAPWRPGVSFGRTGSGAILEGGRILTAAHVVDDATFVQVRRNGSARKFTARVLFVSHAADLALVQVDDPAFSAGVQPLALGSLPAVQGEVAAFGFPNGGETLSITSGVVARVEHGPYVHSREVLLAFQMDAAIDPGSSGGPVIEEGRIAGIAMQGFKDSAIGSAVPAPVVRQFLDDVADGRLDGIPYLGLAVQRLENPALKESLGLPSAQTGVLVRRVSKGPAASVLRAGDVVLELGGLPVGDDGTVEFRPRERTDLGYAVELLQLGASVPVSYLREGRVRRASLQLDRAHGHGFLLPRIFDRGADYYLFGGLAFVTLTRNLLDEAKEWAPPSLAALREEDASTERRELVLLVDILTSEVNSGYSDERLEVVSEVNGRKVASLRDVVEAVEASSGRYVSFGLSAGYRVTINRAEARANAREVLQRYGVTLDRSERLQAALAAPGVPGLGRTAAETEQVR